MMRLIKNGEPVFHTHTCAEERKGMAMTEEEYHAFAVDCLISEYKESGVNARKITEESHGGADISFTRGELTINVKVVCRPIQDLNNRYRPEVDTSWLVEQYTQRKAIPRITLASAYCIDGEDRVQVSGSDFCFQFYSLNAIPNEENDELAVPTEENSELAKKEKEISIALTFAEAWLDLDVSLIEPYLDANFHYSSAWVFDELPSRYEYLSYLKGKFEAMKRTGSKVQGLPGINVQNKNIGLCLYQDKNDPLFLEMLFVNGRITEAKLSETDDRHSLMFFPYDRYFEDATENEIGEHFQSFRSAMEKQDLETFKNLDCIIPLLPNIKIKKGYTLDAFQVGSESGNVCKLYVCRKGSIFRWMDFFGMIGLRYKDYQFIHGIHSEYIVENARIPDVLSYFEVPFNEKGLMDAWLLVHASSFMPKFGHGCYEIKEYNFLKTDMRNLFEEMKDMVMPLMNEGLINKIEQIMEKYNLLPTLHIDDDTATFTCFYLNYWSGLIKETIVARKQGNSVVFEKPQEQIVLRYNCGVRF